jgi:hypothetical protein
MRLAQLAGLTGEPPATNEAVRAIACRELLDRGIGRPAQMTSGDTDTPLIVDFRWADDPVPVARPAPLVIEAELAVGDEQNP